MWTAPVPRPPTLGVPGRNRFLVLLSIFSCKFWGDLALALLVTRVALADHHDVSIAADDAAVVTDRLDAGVDLHCVSFDRCLRTDLSGIEPVEISRYFPAERLLVAVGDAATGQVVGAQLDNNPILRKDPDVVLSHLARDVGEHFVSVGQLNTKHRVGQSFDNCAFDLDDTVFFGHSLFVAKSWVPLVCGGCGAPLPKELQARQESAVNTKDQA